MTLSAERVSFGYEPGRSVLADLSASLAPGRVTVLIGPNGAGKSTLLRVLAGVLRPESGQVRLGGRGLGELSARERASRVAYVPQRASVAFGFSVRAVVRLGRYALGDDASAAESALTRMELAERAEDAFGSLSAGQQQRATLARALAQLGGDGHAGRALLADEPVAAMDPRHALAAMEVLRGLARGGASVGVVLHDLGLTARCADDVIALDARGCIAGAGPAGEVLSAALLERVFEVPFEALERPSKPGVAAGWAPGGHARRG